MTKYNNFFCAWQFNNLQYAPGGGLDFLKYWLSKIPSITKILLMYYRYLYICIFLFCTCSSGKNQIEKTRVFDKAQSLRSPDVNGDIFSDRFDASSLLYENITVGFQMRFIRGWKMYVYSNDFPAKLKYQAELLRRSDRDAGINGEMTLLGMSGARSLHIRTIVEEVNLDLEKYHEIVRIANQKDLSSLKNENSKLINIADKEMIVWEYTIPIQGMPVRFLEYQAVHNKFNFRFTFWSLESIMPSVRDEVQLLMSSLRFY